MSKATQVAEAASTRVSLHVAKLRSNPRLFWLSTETHTRRSVLSLMLTAERNTAT